MLLGLLVFGSLIFFTISTIWFIDPSIFRCQVENDGERKAWLNDARKYLINNADLEDWTNDQIDEYCESLYKLFVLDDKSSIKWTGKQAVKEDMTYWE